MSASLMLLTFAFVAVAVPVKAAELSIAHEPARELRICVDPDNPPLSQNQVDAQPGFDVEIGQAIAGRLQLRPRLVWTDTTYGGKALRRSLLAGRCDVFMTSLAERVRRPVSRMADFRCGDFPILQSCLRA